MWSKSGYQNRDQPFMLHIVWMLLLHHLTIRILFLEILLGPLCTKSWSQRIPRGACAAVNTSFWYMVEFVFIFSQQIFIWLPFYYIFESLCYEKPSSTVGKTKASAFICFPRALDWLAKCKFENIIIMFPSKYLIAQTFQFQFFANGSCVLIL